MVVQLFPKKILHSQFRPKILHVRIFVANIGRPIINFDINSKYWKV